MDISAEKRILLPPALDCVYVGFWIGELEETRSKNIFKPNWDEMRIKKKKDDVNGYNKVYQEIKNVWNKGKALEKNQGITHKCPVQLEQGDKKAPGYKTPIITNKQDNKIHDIEVIRSD